MYLTPVLHLDNGVGVQEAHTAVHKRKTTPHAIPSNLLDIMK